MISRTSADRPTVLATRFLDRKIVDACMPDTHQTVTDAVSKAPDDGPSRRPSTSASGVAQSGPIIFIIHKGGGFISPTPEHSRPSLLRYDRLSGKCNGSKSWVKLLG